MRSEKRHEGVGRNPTGVAGRVTAEGKAFPFHIKVFMAFTQEQRVSRTRKLYKRNAILVRGRLFYWAHLDLPYSRALRVRSFRAAFAPEPASMQVRAPFRSRRSSGSSPGGVYLTSWSFRIRGNSKRNAILVRGWRFYWAHLDLNQGPTDYEANRLAKAYKAILKSITQDHETSNLLTVVSRCLFRFACSCKSFALTHALTCLP